MRGINVIVAEQILKVVGYVQFGPYDFFNINGATLTFPFRGGSREAMWRTVRSALIDELRKRFSVDPAERVTAAKLIVAPARDFDLFRCIDWGQRPWSGARYAHDMEEAGEDLLCKEVVQGRDPREDGLLRQLYGNRSVGFFMHMNGFGHDMPAPCVPCQIDVEVERAFMRAQRSTECSYIVFDRTFTVLPQQKPVFS